MDNTSAKRGNGHPFSPGPGPAPPRPAQFGLAPPAYEKATQRLSAGRTLRKSVLQAASSLGNGGNDGVSFDDGIRNYLVHLGGSTSASDRSAFIGLLSRILPKNVEVSGEVTTGVTIKLPWLEQSRAVDAIATPAGGVVIDQTTGNIDESDDV